MSVQGQGQRSGAAPARFRSTAVSRPSGGAAEGSLECQKETHAVQQKVPLLDHLVGAGDEHRWHVQAERSGGDKVQSPTGELLLVWGDAALGLGALTFLAQSEWRPVMR